MNICENIETVKTKIEKSCLRAGRSPKGVKLVAVSKKKPAGLIHEALNCGHLDFGENIPQELRDKAKEFAGKNINWHFIGHLQRNKIKYVLPAAGLVHSLDSLKLAAAMEEWMQKHRPEESVKVLLQLHTAKEETKQGISADDFFDLADEWFSLPHLRICGVMTIATNTEDEKEIRRCFSEARSFFETLNKNYFSYPDFQWLSMGMSHDFEIAVEEGANMVRVGSAIFGAREY
jgi:pyridoxal phosphate enzyme (YggS family)